MICWSCQVENPSAAKFCFNCGSRLAVDPATEAPCRSCGAPLPLDARFCGNCGTPVVTAAPATPLPATPLPATPLPAGLADVLEPAPSVAPEPEPSLEAEASALAYDHEEEDEATVSRPGLEEPPMVPSPGLRSRDHSNTEPAKVAMARTLAERLGRSGDSPGAYSKQGPSLRKSEGKGKPPPPPAIGTKAAPEPAAGLGAKRATTEQSLPRTGLLEPPAKTGSKLPPIPSVAPRPVPSVAPRPVAGARPAASTSGTVVSPAPGPAPVPAAPTSGTVVSPAPGPAPVPAASTSGTVVSPAPGPAPVPAAPAPASKTAPGLAPAPTPGVPASKPAPASASISKTVPAPSGLPPRPVPGIAGIKRTTEKVPHVEARPPAPLPGAAIDEPEPPPALELPPLVARPGARTTTEPQRVVFAAPTPSEVAEILAPPDGWPDITDELAEVRFSALQGVDEGVLAELATLRAKYPGHPEVDALTAELGATEALALAFEDSLELPVGVPRRTRPPVAAEPSPASSTPLTAVDGAPPLGRFPAAEPTASSPSRSGAPRPVDVETSDELLDMDGDEFDELDEHDEPDPGESMSDMTIVERFDLERLGVRDADELDQPADDDLADDLDEPDEPDFVDRTMMVPGLQPPAPYGAKPPPGAAAVPAARPAAERRPTLVPDLSAVDERRRATLAPGADVLDERRRATLAPGADAFDEERRSTLPPGSLVAEHDDPPTLSGLEVGLDLEGVELDEPAPPPRPGRSATLVPRLDDADGPPAPAPFAGPGGEPAPGSFMTAPDRDADTAAASGQFRVADLDLDDMPDLSAGLPPAAETELEPAELEPAELESAEIELTYEGTVVVRGPLPPAPFGQGAAPLPVVPVRLVMLGPRGEAVAERRIEAGAFLDVGRRAGEPWSDDRRMEPLHARLFPAPGGVIVDDFGLPSGVYTQILDTIAVGDGDEFKVGQARLALQRVQGRGWGQLTVVRHDVPAPITVLLDRDEIIIGREEGDITLPSDTFVSGDHCRFVREGNAIYLEDLGSSNGTYIRVRAGQCVAFGALILVGHTQFRVQPG